jgi:hypothetical protein
MKQGGIQTNMTYQPYKEKREKEKYRHACTHPPKEKKKIRHSMQKRPLKRKKTHTIKQIEAKPKVE